MDIDRVVAEVKQLISYKDRLTVSVEEQKLDDQKIHVVYIHNRDEDRKKYGIIFYFTEVSDTEMSINVISRLVHERSIPLFKI